MIKIIKFIYVITINVIIFFVGIYAVEVYFEVTDPKKKLPFNGVDDTGTYYTWGNIVVENSYGFREIEFERNKEKDVFRIMVLGDSLTWGAGLKLSERYTNRLQKLLNSHFDDIRFEVLNFAVSGGPTVLERDIFIKYADIVKPDLVIIGFCENDPEPRREENARRYYSYREAYKVIRSWPEFIENNGFPYLAKEVKKGLEKFGETMGWFPSWLEVLGKSYDKSSNDWAEFEKALIDIKSKSDSMGLPAPIFSVLNRGPNKKKPNNFKNPDKVLRIFIDFYRQAEESARIIGFTTVNVEAELAEEFNDKVMAVNSLDAHPNADVNEIYARKLFSLIKDKQDELFINHRYRH